jgi:hypothetical protein
LQNRSPYSSEPALLRMHAENMSLKIALGANVCPEIATTLED